MAPIAVFWPSVLGYHLLGPGDGYQHYLPLHVLAARAWKSGHLPAWNPFAFSGYPLLSTNQAAVFYPPNALFVVMGPALANNLTVVLSFVIAGAGAFLLARHLCGDDLGAVVAGLGFGLCGFMFAHLGHQSMIASIAWLPWTLLGFELLRQRQTPIRLLMASGALALALIAGHSQMFALVALVLGLYAAGLAALELRETRGRPLLLAAVVGVAAAGLAAVQLVPTLSILHETDRSRLSYEDATSFSYSPSHLPLIAFPYAFGEPYPVQPYSAPYRGRWNLTELSGYPGMAVLALAGAGLGALRRDRRAVALVGAGAVTLLVTMGGTTPVGRLVYHLPVLGQFRSWARYVVVTDLVLAVLAAYGVAALRSGPQAARRAAAARAAIVAALVVGVAAVLPALGPMRKFLAGGHPRLFALGVPALAAVAGAVGAVMLTRGRRIAAAGAVGLVAVVALDAVFSFGWFYEWRTHTVPVAGVKSDFSPSTPTLWGRVADAPGGLDRWVYASSDLGPSGLYVDQTDVKGYRSVNGFDPLAPKRYLRAVGDMVYYGVIQKPDVLWQPGSQLLDLLRVTTVLINPPSTVNPPPADSVLGAGSPVPNLPLVRYEYRPRLPDAFLVGSVERRPLPDILKAVSGRTSFLADSTALVEDQCRGCGAAKPGPAGKVLRTTWHTQDVHVEMNADRAAMLVVSQAWFPGWHASVDGRSASVVRVDGVVQGVPVPAGRHRVDLSYRAPGMRVGAAVSAFSLAVLVGLVVVVRRRGRSRGG